MLCSGKDPLLPVIRIVENEGFVYRRVEKMVRRVQSYFFIKKGLLKIRTKRLFTTGTPSFRIVASNRLFSV